jgi:hypothetical protein
MTNEEMAWLSLCRHKPKEFRIDVDNDSVFVTDTDTEECLFEFNNYGWQMVLELLRYLGCNAEEV